MSEYKETCTRFIETIYRFVMPENYSLLQTDTLVETQYASGVWTGEVFQNVHRLLHQYVYYDQELAQLLQSYHQEYLTRIFDNCDPDSLKFIAGQVKNASPKTLNPLRDNIVGTLTLLATDAFMTYLLNIENLEVLLGLIHSSDEDIQGLIAHFLEETIDIFISDRDLMMEIAYPERDSEARSKVFSTLMSRMLKMAQENIVFVESDS